MTARYTYLADGTKLSTADNSGSGFAYLGSLVYRKDGSSYTFESTDFSGGRLDNGLSMSATNRYRFSGKEQQTVADVDLLDFGARFYDDEICRWTTIDPLAYKYFGLSPYNYCGNDPVNRFDPDGEDFRIEEGVNSIIVSAVVYTNDASYNSAMQAAGFWNSRHGDTYNGKSIEYHIDIKIISYSELESKQGSSLLPRRIDKKENKYEVNNLKLASIDSNYDNVSGCRDSKTGNIFIRNEYSLKNPWTNEPSTIGAHELGHMLGMNHKDNGIMSKSQDESRNDNVPQENINEMMTSKMGYRSRTFLKFIYDVFSK